MSISRSGRIFLPAAIVSCLLLFAGCSAPSFPVIRSQSLLRQPDVVPEMAIQYFIAARNAERRGFPREAERLLEEAHRLDPSSRVLRDQLARRYQENGRYLQALALVKGKRPTDQLDTEEKRMVAGIYLKTGELARALETLGRIEGKEESDHYSMAVLSEALGDKKRALRHYGALFDAHQGKLETGLKIVGLLLATNQEKSADTLLTFLEKRHGQRVVLLGLAGSVRLRLGDTAAALTAFTRALAIDSMHEESLRGIAQIHLSRDDLAGAIESYEKLFRLSIERRPPLFSDSYGRTLALLYYSVKKYGRAEELLTSLLSAESNNAELQYLLGLTCAVTGRYDLARIAFEKAVVLRKDYADAWQELCNLAIREKELGRCLTVAQRFTRRAPEIKASWRMLGFAHTLRKEYPDALEAYGKALALDSLDARLWFELGSCHERSGDFDSAAAAFRRVLAIRPDDPAAANYLGYMWTEQGTKLDSARILIETALRSEPRNGAFLDSYAWVFYKQGNLDSAGLYIRMALDRVPDDPVVWEHQGDILRSAGDCHGASQAYMTSLEFASENESAIRRKIIDCASGEGR